MVQICKGSCECIQPVLELRAEYPGVCCVRAFFFGAWRNMLVVQPVVELYRNLLKANCGTQFNEIQPVLEICAANHSVWSIVAFF